MVIWSIWLGSWVERTLVSDIFHQILVIFSGTCMGEEEVNALETTIFLVIFSKVNSTWLKKKSDFGEIFQGSGQIIIFHQPRFPWNEGISLTKPPFGGPGRVFGRYNLTRRLYNSLFSFFHPQKQCPIMETPNPLNDTPKRVSKHVACWHPITLQGFLGYVLCTNYWQSRPKWLGPLLFTWWLTSRTSPLPTKGPFQRERTSSNYQFQETEPFPFSWSQSYTFWSLFKHLA